MTPRVFVGDLPAVQATFREDVEAIASRSLAERNRFLIALPGGSVADALFPALAESSVDWQRTHVFWIDERAVPPDHPDSNYGHAERLLLSIVRVPNERVHRMRGELPALDQAARQAADTLESVAGDPPILDLVLAGVGEDGHVASLFPHMAHDVRDAVIAVRAAPKPPTHRLTLSLGVLASAHHLIIAAFGRGKADVMRRALAGTPPVAPVGELLRRAPSALVLLDAEAGALL